MKIDYNKVDSLTANLKVFIAKDDYLKEFNDEIKKHRGKAQLKGFRKGKTPANYIKKLYGDQVLSELINKKAINGMYEYLTENKIETILDPILSDDFDPVTISYKNLVDFEFQFELALMPELKLEGADANDEYIRYNVVPTPEELEENLDKIATQLGERNTVKEDIQDKDIVTLMADVLLTDEEGLTEPIEAEIKVLVSDCTEDFQEAIKKLKFNDAIDWSMANLESKDEAFVRKFYLKMEENDLRTYNDDIKASIVNVERMSKMEIGEPLFKKMFPKEEFTTKDQVIEKLAENTTAEHLNVSNSVMYRGMMTKMMEKSSVELNEEFLLKWAKSSNALKPDADEDEFLKYFKEEIKWNLIKTALLKKFDIKVEEEEILEQAKEQVKGYFGYSVADNDQYIGMIAQNLLNDKEQRRKLYDEALSLKMYRALQADVKIKVENKSLKEFYDIVEELKQKQ